MSHTDTRSRIVTAADDLFYRHGFDHTSFADIAAAVCLSRGNFYYHFKTKDQILAAVIARRLDQTRALLAEWERQDDSPRTCILSFIDILIMNRVKIAAYGCPVGTLCSELVKLDHALQDEATGLFTLFRDWLARQFAALGHVTQADTLAMQLLSRSQGAATLAQAFRDETFLRSEVASMQAWLDAQLTAKVTPCS